MEQTIVDIHAHILPGIDDGATDWEESVKMLDMAISQGIRTIIATPHYSRHLKTAKIRELVLRLSKEAQSRCPEVRIYPGQEILYFDSMTEALNAGDAMTLADSRYVLVEFMPDVSYKKMYQGLRNLLQGGYYPVIAHVERYEAMRTEKQMEELQRMGCLLQMNYSSLAGSVFDKHVRWCRRQIQQERIQVLGTDMHHSTRRAPVIEKSIAWLTKHIEPDYLVSLTHGQGMQILEHSNRQICGDENTSREKDR